MRGLAPYTLALVGCLSALGWAPWVGARPSGSQPGGALTAPAAQPDRTDRRAADGLERWLYNPRERAATGLEALENDRDDDAVRAFDAAANLARASAPEEPWAFYDAGSARLVTGREAERAIDLLEHAADTAPPELAPDALYNLGNARLATGDPAGAVDAYRKALRLAPDLQPAKRNLEIAWRRLENQTTRNEQQGNEPGGEPQDDGQDDQQGEGEETSRAGDEPRPPEGGDEKEPEDGRERSDESDQAGDEPGGDTSGTDQGAQPGAPPPTLPRFQEQPDMTAAQAAALLAAIDHLERSQRHLEAARRARLSAEQTKEKDW